MLVTTLIIHDVIVIVWYLACIYCSRTFLVVFSYALCALYGLTSYAIYNLYIKHHNI